jgi:glycosyltransferase involved in cell wall biosynthesis
VSQAILQAGFLGLPLIATSVGGLGEVCIDGATGFLVDPLSPAQVAQSVMKLKDNPSLCKEMGGNAHQLVLEKFTLEQTLNEMEAVYQQMQSCNTQPLKKI